ncbi:fasciclin domain-containing protein [Lentimicrobium sp.]|jgi:transforming growth factor-beta-induced protein|uniref:fasciclin domain-containing protein n=1 Tax=Lentimicrobium sp. TaxID=2034841 RepID=UPI002BE02321|nr:fasciclin domain-containing protein [Lentimicrobium sp.]HPF63507.1 fasciclin domain-containing protein [Lentimicrobium sp.]
MKTNFLKFRFAVLAIAAVTLFVSCSKDDDNPAPPAEMPKDIVEVAVSDARFSILVEAVSKANLVSALQGDGPFTVFAPTNDAFNALFAQLGVSGIADLDAATLTPILLNHVVAGNIKSSDISTGYVSTLNATDPAQSGVQVFVEKGSGVMVDGSKVIIADVMASNGVIHAIDKVILPANVVNHAINNSNFSILVQAVVKAGLVEALSGTGPFTVFAPTNDAFNALFTALGVSGIDALTAEQLTPILLYHVVPGNVRSNQVSSGSVPTLKDGSNLNVNVSNMGVNINGSVNVIATDVQGSNGVIHVIDAVLVP